MHRPKRSGELDEEHGVRRRRRKWRKRIALWFTAGVIMAISGAAVAILIFVSSIATIFANNVDVRGDGEAFPATGRPPASQLGAVNILLVGTDGPEQSDDDASIAHADGGQRAGSIVVAHLSADRKSITLVSIMRDTWVSLPGHTDAKINAAYAIGGSSLLVAAVENLLGSRMDHVVVAGFGGFERIVNNLGGVDITVPLAFSTDHFTFEAGPAHLDGQQAIEFSRARLPFVDGDHQRVRNQHLLMRAIAAKATSSAILTNPQRMVEFANAATRSLSVDQGLTPQKLFELAALYRSVPQNSIRTTTAPVSGGDVIDGQSVLRVDAARQAVLNAALKAGTVDEYARTGADG